MIFYWMRRAWLFVAWLFTPPTERDVVRMDPDAPCPVCAARSGKLLCVLNGNDVVAMHECAVCLARWFEKPVTKVDATVVWTQPIAFPGRKAAA